MQYRYFHEGQFKVDPTTGTKCRTGQLNHQFVEQKFVGGVWVGIGDNDGVRYGDVAGAGCRFSEGMEDGDYKVKVELIPGGFLLAEGDGWVNCGSVSGWWAPSVPYFALPETGVSLVVGTEVTIYGDSLINIPIGYPLTVTYTCDIGAQVEQNYVINPIEANIGDHSLRMVFKYKAYTIEDKTIILSVYALALAGTKNILMVGDSLMLAGMESNRFQPQILDVLINSNITWLGTRDTITAGHHEGHSGFKWDTFVNNTAAPADPSVFFKAGVLDIPAYFTDNAIDIPDYVKIDLGVNDLFINCATWGTPLVEDDITFVLNNAKTLIDAFLAYDINLKVIIGLPTICDDDGVAWSAGLDSAMYVQNIYIENIHRLWIAYVTTFSGGVYNSRVDCSYEAINLNRDGFNYSNGVHPSIIGYEQYGRAMALQLNKIINDDEKTAFISTWNTENAGSATKTIVIPFYNDGFAANVNIDWGDGIVTRNNAASGSVSHVYTDAGIKTIKIFGSFNSLMFNNGGDKLKILTIKQWGSNKWRSMHATFYGCANLTGTYTDSPDTSLVGEFQYAFSGCSLFNSPVNFNTANGNIFNTMFGDCPVFNQSVSSFDTAKAKDMGNMFYSTQAFNQSLSNFNVEAVVSNFSFFIYNSNLSVVNYSNFLIALASQSVHSGLVMNNYTTKYNAGAAAARAALIADHNWTITDGGVL